METDLIKSKNLGGGVRSSNIELFRILSMITREYPKVCVNLQTDVR